MPPQTTEDLINITGPLEPERLGKPAVKMNPKGQPSQSGLVRVLSYLFESLIRVLSLNWLLGLFGLALVKLDENAEEIPLNKRKNEDLLVENEMKRLKSEAGGDDDEEKKKQLLLKNKSSLITDFTNKLWNLTPNINFSEDTEVETFLPLPAPIPKKVITPSESFDNLLDLGLSETETGPADQPDMEGEETDVSSVIVEEEEEEQKVNYNAEASYRVQVINMRDHQAEKPESVESETVLKRDPNFKVTSVTSGEEDKKPDSEKQVTVLDLEREKERVDDEAAEELLVMKKKSVQSENLVSEKMEARAKENDKAEAGKGGKNRGGNKGKKKKEKM